MIANLFMLRNGCVLSKTQPFSFIAAIIARRGAPSALVFVQDCDDFWIRMIFRIVMFFWIRMMFGDVWDSDVLG